MRTQCLNFLILISILAFSCTNKQKGNTSEDTVSSNVDNQSIELYYEHSGDGEPVIFLHGVWMTSKFFKLQEEYFNKKYAYYALDFRGHGKSPDNGYGHTIKTYAEDLRNFIQEKKLKNVNLVGWSMGSFVIWEYLKQFGKDNIESIVIVDQGAADLQQPGWDIAPLSLEGLVHFMDLVQTDQRQAVSSLIPLMFKDSLPQSELDWMEKEALKIAPNSAASILFNQSMVDYRENLKNFDVPALLIFGADEKLLKTINGEYIHERMPNSELVLFEKSGHCPFIEEPNKFNKTVDNFIQKNNRY